LGYQAEKIVIKATFSGFSVLEKKSLLAAIEFNEEYLVIKKEVEMDNPKGRVYYLGKSPKDDMLKLDNVTSKTKKEYLDKIKTGVLPDYFLGAEQKGNLADIKEGLERYVNENSAGLEFVFDFIEVKGTIQSELLAILPELLYVPAFDDISDYVTSSTRNIFGKLIRQIFDLLEERKDPDLMRMNTQIKNLTNKFGSDTIGSDRQIKEIKELENQITGYLQNILPESAAKLAFNPPEVKDFLPSRIVIQLHDGVLTPVENKGHSLVELN